MDDEMPEWITPSSLLSFSITPNVAEQIRMNPQPFIIQPS